MFVMEIRFGLLFCSALGEDDDDAGQAGCVVCEFNLALSCGF